APLRAAVADVAGGDTAERLAVLEASVRSHTGALRQIVDVIDALAAGGQQEDVPKAAQAT
ncbi:MAG: hypothetical protein Q7J32_01050, partial [Sphingomonadaceae bacterium]|nr:hypothetical protein [Sphingomonadaceae bacterium]